MTSMPASRSARRMTLTPRSWPSSPGFARSTRMGRGCWIGSPVIGARDRSRCRSRTPESYTPALLPEHPGERPHDLAQGHASLGALDERGHQVFGTLRPLLEALDEPGDVPGTAGRLPGGERADPLRFQGGVGPERGDRPA